MSHFFVSYAHNDSNIVKKLISSIKNRNYPVWFDEELNVGDRWRDELARAIIDSTGVIVMMSPASATSEYVQSEVSLARKTNRRVLPVMLSELAPEHFWDLSGIQYEDVRNNKTLSDKFFNKLGEILHTPIKDENILTDEERHTVAQTVRNEVRQQFERYEDMVDYLRTLAKTGPQQITYGDLALKFGIHMRNDGERYRFYNMLGRISVEEHADERPLLSGLVVQSGQPYPGRGYYNLARNLKPEYQNVQDIELYSREYQAIKEYWEGK